MSVSLDDDGSEGVELRGQVAFQRCGRVEGEMRCDSQGPMGCRRIAAADEAGRTQTDVISACSYVLSVSESLRKQAWIDVCTVTSAVS